MITGDEKMKHQKRLSDSKKIAIFDVILLWHLGQLSSSIQNVDIIWPQDFWDWYEVDVRKSVHFQLRLCHNFLVKMASQVDFAFIVVVFGVYVAICTTDERTFATTFSIFNLFL